MDRALGDDLEHLADDLLPLRLPLALEPEVGVEVRLDVGDALEEVAAADDVPVLGIARLPARAQDVLACVEIDQCVGSTTPSSRRRVDGVEVDATNQHECAVKF